MTELPMGGSEDQTSKRIVVGVTGASGAMYAQRLVQSLIAAGVEVHLVVSPFGRRLFFDELDMNEVNAQTLLGQGHRRVVEGRVAHERSPGVQ